MKIRPNREMKELHGELQQAHEHMQAARWTEALELLMRGRAYAKENGFPYSKIAWQICICLDSMEELEEALLMSIEAVDQSPLDPDLRGSFLIIARRLREQVEAANVDDPATPARYKLLSECDAAETGTHVAMARHLAHAGEEDAAAELLEAVTTVEPTCAPAWRAWAEIARARGKHDEVLEYELEAIASEQAIEAAVRTANQLSH